MNTGALEGLGMMLRSVLGLRPGVNRIARGGASSAREGESYTGSFDALSNDFINSVVDITADDVCVGNSPFYVKGLNTIKSPILLSRTEALTVALNSIARWVAVDLLKRGVSAYWFELQGSDRKPCLIPYLLDLQFYMRRDGSVACVSSTGEEVSDLLVFLSYSKESLSVVGGGGVDGSEESSYLYSITPEPIQLKNLGSIGADLAQEEAAMYSYRERLSRIIRMVAVEVGTAMGDRADEIIDTVSQVLNAPSSSLGMSGGVSGAMFQDGIPVLPVRNGKGTPSIIESVPTFDISSMVDLDYTLGKFFLAARFPKTYADFNTALDASAVSLLRGDIRYARMVRRACSLMEDTVNAWYRSAVEGASSSVEFKLVKLPTTEDADVSEVVQSFMDMNASWLDAIESAESEEQANLIIDSLETLLADTSNLHSVQEWFAVTREYVTDKFRAIAAAAQVEEDASADGDSDVDTGVEASLPTSVSEDREAGSSRDTEWRERAEASLAEAQRSMGAPTSVEGEE